MTRREFYHKNSRSQGSAKPSERSATGVVKAAEVSALRIEHDIVAGVNGESVNRKILFLTFLGVFGICPDIRKPDLPVKRYSLMLTVVPAGARSNRLMTASFAMRTQPQEPGLPSAVVAGVP